MMARRFQNLTGKTQGIYLPWKASRFAFTLETTKVEPDEILVAETDEQLKLFQCLAANGVLVEV